MSLHHSPSIVTDGLVLYLDAGNRRSYPGNGNTWFDLSGNNNHASLVGPTFINNNLGSLYLDGINDYISFLGPIESSSDFTIDIWFNPTRINTTYDMIYSGTDNIDIQLFFHQVTKYLTTSIENNEIATSFQLTNDTINKWYNLIFTYDYQFRKVYLNNTIILNTSNSTSFTKNDTNVRLGATLGSSLWLQANISNLKIYNLSLNDNDIKKNFEAHRGRFGL